MTKRTERGQRTQAEKGPGVDLGALVGPMLTGMATVTIHAQESGQSCGQTPRTRWDIEDRSVAEVRGPLPRVLTERGGKTAPASLHI